MMHYKKQTLCVVLILCVALAGVVAFHFISSPKNIETAYQTDIEPMIKRLGNEIEKEDIKACYWKAETLGKTSVGPTPYRMKGFILLSEEKVAEFLKMYTFEPAKPNFGDDAKPEDIGYQNCVWSYHEDFSLAMKGYLEYGVFYLDAEHALLYFHMEE